MLLETKAKMIRYRYINNKVLQVYRSMPAIEYPINPLEIIKLIPNCRYLSYQDFAKVNQCSVEHVIQVCESKSGSSHYDQAQNRYLILCNEDPNENNEGRRRWTCSHELGHIICNHHIIYAKNQLSENDNTGEVVNPIYETEADFFAASLLAPLPLFNSLHIKTAFDVQTVFGLSSTASMYRFKQYIDWEKTRYKTSWEVDMIKAYQQNQSKFSSFNFI